MPIVGGILFCPVKQVLVNHGGIAAYLCSDVRVKVMGAHIKAPCTMVFWRVLLITAMPPLDRRC
jgi:hypothetical protein